MTVVDRCRNAEAPSLVPLLNNILVILCYRTLRLRPDSHAERVLLFRTSRNTVRVLLPKGIPLGNGAKRSEVKNPSL